MTTKHTPGPWVFAYGSIYKAEEHGSIYMADETASRLLMADRNNPKTAPVERDANCRLAAAAPELLEACKRALRISQASMCDYLIAGEPEDGMNRCAERENIRVFCAAIDKAQGK